MKRAIISHGWFERFWVMDSMWLGVIENARSVGKE